MAEVALLWSLLSFEECFIRSEALGVFDVASALPIKSDLLGLLSYPCRDDSSRKKVSDPLSLLVLGSGDEIRVSPLFVESVSVLAAELNLDEVVTAELLYNATSLSGLRGTSLLDSARIVFYDRLDSVLTLVGCATNQLRLEALFSTSEMSSLFSNLLVSFEKVYSHLTRIDEIIEKQKFTNDINSLEFVNGIIYSKSRIFSLHEQLGKLLFELFNKYPKQYATPARFFEIIAFVNKYIEGGDVMALHFVPGTLCLITQTFALGDDKVVDELYKGISDKLTKEYQKSTQGDSVDVSRSSFKGFDVVIFAFFFTTMTEWCKGAQAREMKYDFKSTILQHLECLINLDVMEHLLCFSADTASAQTKTEVLFDKLYDFRSLLQRSYPRLSPLKLVCTSSKELKHAGETRAGFENASKLVDTSIYTVSEEFCDLLVAPYLHQFFVSFVSNAAIILTLLRDSEEDFLLSSVNRNLTAEVPSRSNTSGEALDLIEVASQSELERFYLAFYYTYSNRHQLSSRFWDDEAHMTDFMGFFGWGLSNSSSPLVTATFCLLLSSLIAKGNDVGALKIWDLLSNHPTAFKKKDHFQISFQSIIDSLNYYIDALEGSLESELELKLRDSQKRLDFVFSGSSKATEPNTANERIVIELAEDGIVFISGFIQLLSALSRSLSVSASNCSPENTRAKVVKQTIIKNLMPIITGYCRFDNLVMGDVVLAQESGVSVASHTKLIELPDLALNGDNRVVLINLMMHLLADFVEGETDLDLRYNVWRVLDRWIYQAMPSRRDAINQDLGDNWMYRETQMKLRLVPRKVLRISEGFRVNLTQFAEVNNFLTLLSKLLRPINNSNDAFKQYHLLYPADLGFGYRKGKQIGIWPYMEYVMNEIFANSVKIADFEEKCALQSIVLDIVQNSLDDVDWEFLEEPEPFSKGFIGRENNIYDSLIPAVPLNHRLFIELHHSVAALNFLFGEQCDNALFTIIDLGVDISNESQIAAHLISQSLEVVKTVLNVQDTFLLRLLPQLCQDRRLPDPNGPGRHGSTTSLLPATPVSTQNTIYYPKDLVARGVGSFYEILSGHLASVAQFALYVGSPHAEISSIAIQLMGLVAGLTHFVSSRRSGINGELLDGNRLLTAFESIDESQKIKYAFVDVMERNDAGLAPKLHVLRFLIQCLNQNDGKEASVAHFLLGFTNRGGYLSSDPSATGNSLLDSIISCLQTSIQAICEVGYTHGSMLIIRHGPAKFCMLALQVLVKLCESPISVRITLNMLDTREGLLESLLSVHPKIDTNTIWGNALFNSDLTNCNGNAFIEDPESYQTLLLFIGVRNLTLQLVALKIHGTLSITKRQYYIGLLLETKEFMDGSPKLLNYMDISNLTLINDQDYEHIKSKYNVPLIMQRVLSKSVDEIDFLILTQVLRATCQAESRSSKEVRLALSNQVIADANVLRTFLTKVLVSESLREAQLNGLRSWCQLMRLLLSDVAVSHSNAKDLVFGGLQIILPKLDDAISSDWAFADEMMSLCVSILEAYDLRVTHASQGDDYELGARKLIPLFKTCISGTTNSLSSTRLRLDLYVLLNRLITSAFERKLVAAQLDEATRMIDGRFLEKVASDAIYADGSLRVTAIILLELLVHSATRSGSNHVLGHMIKSNTFVLLMQATRVTNDLLELGSKANLGVPLDALLFELTAFRATLCFLTRVAQTKAGALQLVQGELFEILQQCQFLKIDPDMGLLLSIEDESDCRRAKISLVLDAPKVLQDVGGNGKHGPENVISYFEFLIPIFRLVTTVLVSLGPQYRPGIEAARGLFASQKALIAGIVKRDVLMDRKKAHGDELVRAQYPIEGLDTMVDLIALFQALIEPTE